MQDGEMRSGGAGSGERSRREEVDTSEARSEPTIEEERGVAGTVIAQSGYEGKCIELYLTGLHGDEYVLGSSSEVVTVRDGRGAFRVPAGKLDLAPVWIAADVMGIRRASWGPFELGVGWLDVGDLRLQSGGSVTIMVESDGLPAPGCAVIGSWALLGAGEHSNSVVSLGETDRNGVLRLNGVPPGQLRVSASARGLSSAWTGPVNVSEGVDFAVVISLENAVRLNGRVWDAVTGDGLSGVVEFSGSSSCPPIEVEVRDGRFETDRLLPGKRYVYSARVKGYALNSGGNTLITVEGRLPTVLDVPLERICGMELAVVDAQSRERVRNAQVWSLARDGKSRRYYGKNPRVLVKERLVALSDENGIVKMADAIQSTGGLAVFAYGYAPRFVGISSGPRDQSPRELLLTREARVFVTWRGEEVKLIERCTIEEWDQLRSDSLLAGTEWPESIDRATASAIFDGLPGSCYVVKTHLARGGTLESEPLVIHAGEVARLEIALPAMSSGVVGRIACPLDDSFRYIIELSGPSRATTRCAVRGDGHFEASHLPAGETEIDLLMIRDRLRGAVNPVEGALRLPLATEFLEPGGVTDLGQIGLPSLTSIEVEIDFDRSCAVSATVTARQRLSEWSTGDMGTGQAVIVDSKLVGSDGRARLVLVGEIGAKIELWAQLGAGSRALIDYKTMTGVEVDSGRARLAANIGELSLSIEDDGGGVLPCTVVAVGLEGRSDLTQTWNLASESSAEPLLLPSGAYKFRAYSSDGRIAESQCEVTAGKVSHLAMSFGDRN